MTPDESVEFVRSEIEKLRGALAKLVSADHTDGLVAIADSVVESLRSGGKVMFCGNGGSAADAQHLAAELVGRQNYDRPPAAGLALTVDSSALTALSNDYGYDVVFARQVEALGRPGDVLFGISTSGRSKSVVLALEAARAAGMTTVSFTGSDPREMAGSDHVLAVPATETAKIQELQLTSGHIVFALVERELYPRDAAVSLTETEVDLSDTAASQTAGDLERLR